LQLCGYEAYCLPDGASVLVVLVWLKRTPEAQAALQLTVQRVASKPRR
jgi:hypothetical protein